MVLWLTASQRLEIKLFISLRFSNFIISLQLVKHLSFRIWGFILVRYIQKAWFLSCFLVFLVLVTNGNCQSLQGKYISFYVNFMSTGIFHFSFSQTLFLIIKQEKFELSKVQRSCSISSSFFSLIIYSDSGTIRKTLWFEKANTDNRVYLHKETVWWKKAVCLLYAIAEFDVNVTNWKLPCAREIIQTL